MTVIFANGTRTAPDAGGQDSLHFARNDKVKTPTITNWDAQKDKLTSALCPLPSALCLLPSAFW